MGEETWDEIEVGAGADDDQVKQAFETEARRGHCRGRSVKWMILIDEMSEQRRAVAVYGDAPPRELPDDGTHVIDGRTERFPAVG